MKNPSSLPEVRPQHGARAESVMAAWVGLDWADQGHQICLYDSASAQIESETVEPSAEALQAWLGQLRQRYGGAPVAVVLEQARGAVIYALMSCEFVVLYPVNPQSLASYRKALRSSGAKGDASDAGLLMEMVRKHPERFRAWRPEDPQTRSLQQLTEGRRKLVNQRTALIQQLTSLLKGYYPQALEWAGELGSFQACDFLKQWPSLADLQKTRPSRLRNFYLRYGRPRQIQLDQRLDQIRQAVALTQDPAVLLSSSMQVEALADQIRLLLATIERFDEKIAQLFRRHPDRALFESFPGAGRVMAPRLVAAFGADRARFQSAREMQQLSGIAPVTEESGQQRWVHWRLACPKFLRQTFHEFAALSILWSDWARAYYQQQRARGKKHHAAVRALAYKWIRILFRCWQTRTPYDEQIYLKALERRHSPLWSQVQAVQESKPESKPGKKVA